MFDYIKWCFILFLMVSVNAQTDDGGSVEKISYTYEIMSEGKLIGSFDEQRFKSSSEHLQINRNTSIDVSMAFWRLNFISSETLVFYKNTSGEYRLHQVGRNVTEDGKTYRVDGNQREQGFYLNAGFLANMAKANEDLLSEVTLAVATSAIPYLGTVLSIFSEDEKTGKMMLSNHDYDATVADIPFLLNQLSHQPKSFRLLDTQELEVNNYVLILNSAEDCSANGVIVSCQKVQVRLDDHLHCYWIAEDRLGSYLVRAEGVDRDGPYRIEMGTAVVSSS